MEESLIGECRPVCEVKRSTKAIDPQSDPDRLYAKIGQLNMELEWLKKKLSVSL